MFGYEAGPFSLVPLLERLDYKKGESLTLRMEGLELGELKFLSGTVRLQPNGRAHAP